MLEVGLNKTDRKIRKLIDLVGSGATVVGAMVPLPFRTDELPFGFFAMNGDRYALASEAGKVLHSFSENFKSDWGITVVNQTINVQDWFDPETGKGYFPRAVDGVERLPGSVEKDAGRNVVGYFLADDVMFNYLSGCFYACANTPQSMSSATSGNQCYLMILDASRNWGTAHTANEFRPLNRGMTMAMYLGVAAT